MGGSMSRDKGQRAERKVIELLQPVVTEVFTEHGLDVPKLQRNTLQSDGGGFDIVGLDWMALEVKHQETLAVDKWWQQTLAQAKGIKEPILFYKQNNVKFRVRIKASIWIFKTENEFLAAPIEMDIDSFLIYFKARLQAELRYIP